MDTLKRYLLLLETDNAEHVLIMFARAILSDIYKEGQNKQDGSILALERGGVSSMMPCLPPCTFFLAYEAADYYWQLILP